MQDLICFLMVASAVLAAYLIIGSALRVISNRIDKWMDKIGLE